MKIACYGWAGPQDGSMGTANHHLMLAMSRSGHDITFFAKRGLVDTEQFLQSTVRVVVCGAGDYTRWLAPLLDRSLLLRTLYNRGRSPRNRALVSQSVRQEGPFDAVLVLATNDRLDVPGLVVGMPQSPPGVESLSFLRLWSERPRPRLSFRSLMLLGYQALRWFGRRRAAQRLPDYIICPSDWSRQRYIALGHHQAKHVGVAPFALAKPSPIESCRSGSDENGGPHLLHLGRLDPRKRLDLLIAAFALFRERYPTATLDVVGREGYLPELGGRLLAKAPPGITRRNPVPREQVWQLLADADVLVQTSQGETFGNSVAEGLLVGIPVVVGEDNGTAQFVAAPSTVFSSYDARSICDGLEQAYLGGRSQESRSDRAAAAAARFDPDAVASSVTTLLQNWLASAELQPPGP